MRVSGYLKHILFILVATPFLLTGCVSRQTTAIIQTPAGMTTGAKEFSVSKTVLSGRTLNLASVFNLNPDCTPRSGATIQVIQQPVNGTAAVTQREDFPNFPAANTRAACNKNKALGTFADYTPNPGFTGSDFTSIEYFSDLGADYTIKISITVK